jgi:NAD+ synthase (glutamine-hydrolysing)
MSEKDSFFNLYQHNFVRAAVAVPQVRVADPEFNAEQTVALMREAAKCNALLAVFPELGISSYSCEDLFHQKALLDGCLKALSEVLRATKASPVITIVGLPIEVDSLLFNCAAVLYRSKILGVIPKTYLPNYREYYEGRQFVPADFRVRSRISICGQHDVPFSNHLLFRAENYPALNFYVEICEDLWVPIPPSSFAALAGATVLINLSASNVTVGKEDYRRLLVSSVSARCMAAYVYVGAGAGESTTDMAWDGHGMIYENGTCLGETARFTYSPQLLTADIDLDRLVMDRMRQNSFGQAVERHREAAGRFETVSFYAELPTTGYLPLARLYERFPYVPAEPAMRDERCREVYEIQVQGLVTRLKSAKVNKIVIGISGGLDSTHALLVCTRAADVMRLPRDHILAYTMPGFGTGERTLEQARRLMAAVGCTASHIDIRPSCMALLREIGHPYARGEPVYDITFENVQAGERTNHLFRLANMHGGLVVGTSDLSELALGWCTYGVGDHMSHYHVNASVPKTLIQYLIRWVAESEQLGAELGAVLKEVLATEISPELIPGPAVGQPTQRSEEQIGPYELQDFNLYYTLRFGYAPTKIAFLAWSAWHDRTQGPWPDGYVAVQRHQYGIGEIKHWLGVFLRRFFELTQYKRSCIPNAPKVGSGGSLSPRSDYRAPSDSQAAVWLAQLARIPDEEPVAVDAKQLSA